jgi:hypothetical protein
MSLARSPVDAVCGEGLRRFRKVGRCMRNRKTYQATVAIALACGRCNSKTKLAFVPLRRRSDRVGIRTADQTYGSLRSGRPHFTMAPSAASTSACVNSIIRWIAARNPRQGGQEDPRFHPEDAGSAMSRRDPSPHFCVKRRPRVEVGVRLCRGARRPCVAVLIGCGRVHLTGNCSRWNTKAPPVVCLPALGDRRD